MGQQYKAAVGVRFLEAVRIVMAELDDYLEPIDSPAPALIDGALLVGNKEAMVAFVRKSRRRMPKAATMLYI